MPLVAALLLGLGSFFGYTGIQSGTADQALTYLQQPVKHHNKPWTIKLPSISLCDKG